MDWDSQQISGRAGTCINNYNIIVSLLSVPFSKRDDNEKYQIIDSGRPTPKLNILKTHKGHSRSFQTSWYDQHKWLCGSEETLKVYCWPCLLMSTKKSVWSAEGFDDLKNITRALERHESSKDHLNAYLSLKHFSHQSCKLSELLNQHKRLQKIKFNEDVKKNREVFKMLIDVTGLLCKQELAFRSHNETKNAINPGNFNAIFDFVLSKNQELKQHCESMTYFKELSETIQTELIECFKVQLEQCIANKINDALFFACMVDETSDSSDKIQLSVVVRLVDSSGEIREYFLGFYNVDEERSADGVYAVLCKALEQFDMKQKLVAQSYDGGCVMSGELSGLQAKVKEVAPQAVFTHCYAHRFNLVLKQSCSKIKTVNVFFCTLQGIPAFFHGSSKRTAVLDRILGKRCFPTNSEDRWNCNAKIISAVQTNRLKLIEVFTELSESTEAVTVREAQGYLSKFEDFTFVFLLYVFQSIFEKTDLLFATIKKIPNHTSSSNSSVAECISHLRGLRTTETCDQLIQVTETAAGTSSLALNPLQRMEKVVIASSNHHKNIYFEVLDNVITQLEVRFSTCEEFTFLKLGETKNFSDYDKEFPNDALTSLVNTYDENFDKEKLKTELQTIYSPVHKNKFHSVNLNKIIKQMILEELHEILPETFKLFVLLSTIPAFSSSIERSSSYLQRINSFLRNTISEDRLSALALASIEKETLQDLERKPAWHDDVIHGFANMKERHVNLFYTK